MRVVAVLIAHVALLSACQSQEDESVSSCVSRFETLKDSPSLNRNGSGSGDRNVDIIYTYDISEMRDDERTSLLRQRDIIIDGAVGGDYRQTEQNFMKKPVTASPRALLDQRTLYRIRYTARGGLEDPIAYGCSLLGPGARLKAIDTTI